MLSMLGLVLCAGFQDVQFAEPVRLKAGEEYVRVESPG